MHDLLAAIPAVLGYRPRDSIVVVVCLDRRIELTLRVDMTWFVDDYDIIADQFANVCDHYPEAKVFLLGYSTDHSGIQAALIETMEVFGQVADAVFTDGQRWWSLICPDDCCPPEGRPFSYETSRASAEAVLAGVPISCERSDVVARVAGPDESSWPHLRETILQLADEIGEVADLVVQAICRRQRFLSDPGELSEQERLWWVLALDQPEVLEEILAILTPDYAYLDREWLLQVVAYCPPERAVTSLAILGFCCWLGGGGPILTATLDRLSRLRPTHPMVAVLNHFVHGLIPSPGSGASN